MRRVLLVLLGLGVFFGYGSAIASARWHARAHHGGGCESRWGGHHRGADDRFEAPRPAAAPVQVPAPQTVVIPQAAPAAPASQQIFLVMPGAQAPQVITVPAAAPAPAPVQ